MQAKPVYADREFSVHHKVFGNLTRLCHLCTSNLQPQSHQQCCCPEWFSCKDCNEGTVIGARQRFLIRGSYESVTHAPNLSYSTLCMVTNGYRCGHFLPANELVIRETRIGNGNLQCRLDGTPRVWWKQYGTRVPHILDDPGEGGRVVVHVVAAEAQEAHEYEQAAAVEEMAGVAEGEGRKAKPFLVRRAGQES